MDIISSFPTFHSYEFTEASTVKDSGIDSQDRYENTTLSSDFGKEGFSDAFSDFDKELKQEINGIKMGLDVIELGTSSFSMLVASLNFVLFLKVQLFKQAKKFWLGDFIKFCGLLRKPELCKNHGLY